MAHDYLLTCYHGNNDLVARLLETTVATERFGAVVTNNRRCSVHDGMALFATDTEPSSAFVVMALKASLPEETQKRKEGKPA